MNATTELFQIDGKAMVIPDAGVEVSYSDLDAADSGRDESGFMHRLVVRHKIPSWQFSYTHLDAESYAYMRSILPRTGTFLFTYPNENGEPEQLQAYISKYSVLWENLRLGDYRNLKFSIIGC